MNPLSVSFLKKSNAQQRPAQQFIKRLVLLILLVLGSFLLIKGIYALGPVQATDTGERKFKVKEFKDMPLEVKVKNLQSTTWHKDIEIEIKNISDKPIYFVLAYLIFPDDKVSDGEVGIRLMFGKRENIRIDHLADPDDAHIDPRKTYVFTIPEPFRQGFEGRHKRYPDLDKTLLLRFAVISFGDGSGFEVGEPRDHKGKTMPAFEVSNGRVLKKRLLIAACPRWLEQHQAQRAPEDIRHMPRPYFKADVGTLVARDG
ncbi:MAG: hypothetical protein ABR557_04915 [Pyrinomonadaceae bacterium]